MNEKDEIEKNIFLITELLEQPGFPGVKGKLVDDEGFPLANIDIFQTRKLRNSLACL